VEGEMRKLTSGHRQRGVTAIGWIFLLLPIFVLGYVAMRAIKPYSNFVSVVRALDNFAKDNDGNGTLTKPQLVDLLSRKWDTEFIYNPRIEDLSITKADGGWRIAAEYEEVVPVFYNISLLFTFDKTVQFQ
jgi:hypothetical protein